jgi:hypothetical protein
MTSPGSVSLEWRHGNRAKVDGELWRVDKVGCRAETSRAFLSRENLIVLVTFRGRYGGFSA